MHPKFDLSEVMTLCSCCLQMNLGSSAGILDGNSSTIVLANQTYNNSVQTTNLTASFTSETPFEALNMWSSDVGLDSYLTSSVSAAVPNLDGNDTADSSSR